MPHAIVSIELEQTREGTRILQVLACDDPPHIRYMPLIQPARGRVLPGWATAQELMRAEETALAEIDRVIEKEKGNG